MYKNRSIIILLLLLTLLISCKLTTDGVYYNELPKPPKLFIDKQTLVVKLDNSKWNNQFSIYKLKTKTKEAKKIIYLKAYQGINKPYKNDFFIKLSTLVKDDISKYKLIWIDPDDNEVEIFINAK